MKLTISNVGTGTLDWRIEVPSENWISVDQNQGSLVNASPVTIDVRLDREKAPVGQQQVTLVVTGGSGRQEVIVKAVIQDRSPVLEVDPVNLDFGETNNSLLLTVSNTGVGSLHWSIAAPSEGWIELSQRDGNLTDEPVKVDVRIDRSKAPSGRQQVTLVVTGDGGARQEVVLTVMILRPTLVVSPTDLNFEAGAQSKLLVISNGGTGALNWNVAVSESWLQVNPPSGRTLTQASTLTVSVDRSHIEENGTYTTELVITSDGGTIVVPVTMAVSGIIPVLRVSPVSLAYGETSTRKTIGISNSGSGVLNWQASSAQAWISVSPDSGSVNSGGNPAQVAVEVDRSLLPPGENSGSIDVTSDGGSVSVPVTVSVPTPVISLSTRTIDFRSDLDLFTLEIANTGNGDLTWEFSHALDWLYVEPASGTTGQVATPVQLSVRRQGLETGSYDGLLRLSSNSTSEPVIDLQMKMQVSEQPELTVQPDSLDFGSEEETLSLQVANANNGTLTWQAETEDPWIGLDATGGDIALLGEQDISVTVRRQGLTAGSYQGRISLSSNGGSQTVPITMVVEQQPRLALDSASLDFSSASIARSVELTNVGTGRLTWNVQEEVNWCEVAPTEGTTLEETDLLTFTVNRKGLAPGTYTAIVAIVSDGGAQEVAVEMQVAEEPILSIDPVELEFGQEEELLPLSIANQGNAPLIWGLSTEEAWIRLEATNGELDAGQERELQIRVEREGLPLGLYEAVLVLDSNGGKREIPLSMMVGDAILVVSEAELAFGEQLDRIAVVLENEGNIPLLWSIEEEIDWLAAEAVEGNIDPGNSQEIEVAVDRTGLDPGDYYGSLILHSSGKEGTVELAVSMRVLENNVPVADAGDDLSAIVGETVQLDGSGSRDADGDELNFRWTAPEGIALDDSLSVRPSFVASGAGMFRISLVVNDGQASSLPAELVVTVVDNTADAVITGEVVEGEGGEDGGGGTADAEITGEIVDESDSGTGGGTADAQISGEIVDEHNGSGESGTADAQISGEIIDGGGSAEVGTADAEITGEVEEDTGDAQITGEVEN